MHQQLMEAVNGGCWQQHYCFSMLENVNVQDFAIRQYCPARLKEQEVQLRWEDHHHHGDNSSLDDDYMGFGNLLWCPSPTYHHQNNTGITTCPYDHELAASLEEEEIVDTFFNVECFEKDNKNLVVAHQEEAMSSDDHDHFGDFEDFSMITSSTIGDILAQGVDDEAPVLVDFEEDDGELGVTISCSYDNPDHDLGSVIDSDTMPGGVQESSCQGPVDQGLQLVHFLLACAEAMGCRDTQLADSILSQIWPSVSPWGDSLQRVSYCFAMGLKSRLSLLQNVNANGTLSFTNMNGGGNGAAAEASTLMISSSWDDKMEAFQLLHQTTPYISFGFVAANDAICQAAKGKDFLHILDLGSGHHLQWSSLIRNLACRAEGPPKLVRITSILEDQERPPVALEAGMKDHVVDEGSSLGMSLEYNIITGPVTPSLLSKENLGIREGEELFVNSIMHLHKFVKESRGSLKTILQAIKRLGPVLLTVVEQDANHNGPFFLGRFLESLHYYSAIFDSLEASLPRDSPQRMKIEKFHFAEEIRNIVAYEGSERIERHERANQWRRQLGRAGFQVVGLKSMSQERMMLSVYGCEDYTLASEKGCLLLGWKGRPIMLASAWLVTPAQG
ncbi:hypothetical protein ACH5RR_038207 [Cinchona calisaya]|uniref:Uncharacterized protein n=1 Tax=Cinchona calisaya TaxID=153742 RepID=A0ABD2Y8D9_9GENT